MNSLFPISILLAAPDGITSRSMVTLLGTIARIGTVHYVTNLPAALESLGREPTQALLLDDDLLGNGRDQLTELSEFIQQCNSIQPNLAISVLLSSLQKKQAVRLLGARPMLKGLLEDELRHLPEQVFAASLQLPGTNCHLCAGS